ncbi:MAG TPA: replication initiation factor domain-containing protein [Armatimonadota bacterium]
MERIGVIRNEGTDDAPGHTWREFLGLLLASNASMKRIDVAVDDHCGILSMQDIQRRIRQGYYVCRARNGLSYLPHGCNTADGEQVSYGESFGSRKGQRYLRIYDKAVQTDTPGPWIRVEFELKHRAAQLAANRICEEGMAGMAGVLKSYIDFKEPGANKQKSRWRTWENWDVFLGRVAKSRLDTAPRVRDYMKTRAWTEKNARPLALVALVEGEAYVSRLIARGRDRLTPEDWALVRQQMPSCQLGVNA